MDSERVCRFSGAVRRLVSARPALLRFARTRPRPRALLRARADVPEEDARRAIRRMRQRVFVHTAAAELDGASPLESGSLWSELADAAIALADRVAYRETTARYGVPTHAGRPIGRAVFALGKLGARELNPSSDVDLMFAYGTDDGGAGDATPHEIFTRWVRRLRALLADVDEDGFGFRVDLDLRPEGTTGPLVNSVDALESYYERFGRTWERAAMARLRTVVDVGGTGAAVTTALRPFVFPRHLDHRHLDELADMKRRVTATATDAGFDVKRGEGGIREVEFVVQAVQLVYGGRVAALRTGSTVELLHKLETRGLIAHRRAAELREGYVALRRIEHALQYREDQQTQTLPDEGDVRREVARALAPHVSDPFSTARRRPGFEASLKRHRRRIHRAFTQLLGEGRGQASAEAEKAVERTAPDEERLAALAALGFAGPEEALRVLRSLERLPASPFAPQVAGASGAAGRLGARLLDDVATSPAPATALVRLGDLFAGFLPRALLARLAEEERLRSLLVRVLATSAPLARLLSRQAGLYEVLLTGMSAPRIAWAAAQRELESAAADDDGDNDEATLAHWRRVQARATLRTGVAFLGGTIGVVRAGHRLSMLADAILEQALAFARRRVARRYGEPDDARFSVLGLGRLGGRELGFFADVDIVFVYEADGATDGARAVPASEWAARVAQQTISALSVPLTGGRCYEVDTRLRPSGNQGPLVTRLAAFERYHETRAELWERQAMIRLRPVAGDRALGRAVRAAARRQVARAAPERLGTQLLDMRARMVSERAGMAGGLDLKMGEGSLSDIEFAVQGLILKHASEVPGLAVTSTRRALRRLAARDALAPALAERLTRSLDRLATVREALTLIDDRRGAHVTPDDERLALLTRAYPALALRAGADGGEGSLYDALVREAVDIRETTHRVLVRL